MRKTSRKTKKFAEGTWPTGLKRSREMLVEYFDRSRSLVQQVDLAREFPRSQAQNKRDEQLLIRLAVHGYLICDTLKKNVDERIYSPAPEKPRDNFLNL